MYVEDVFATPDRVEVLYISPKQAAARYSLSEDTITKMVHMAEFPDIMRVGRRILIPLVEFDKFMERYRTSQERYVPKESKGA